MIPGRRGRRSERGATLVESAFVAPVFFLLVFAVFEFGFILRNHLVVTSATSEAARAASVFGDNQDADFQILRTLEHALAPVGLESLDYVVIYEASGPDDTVPPNCRLVSSAALNCNRYTRADFFLQLRDAGGNPTGNFLCDTAAVDRHWCPTDRETRLSVGPDYVGILVQVRHDYMTGFIGDSRAIVGDRVVRIEPEAG